MRNLSFQMFWLSSLEAPQRQPLEIVDVLSHCYLFEPRYPMKSDPGDDRAVL